MNRVLKRLDHPDERRAFEMGTFDVVHDGPMVLGRATYSPGWKWSSHVGPTLGKTLCDVEHVGMVLAGRVAVAMHDGQAFELGPGDVFHIGPGHDSWVVGDDPYISLHFMGAEEYAREGGQQ